MRALRLVAANEPLQAFDLPVPVAEPDEAVVRVAAAGVCRSDVHYRSGSPKLPPLPRTLGHEIAGEVVALGDGSAGGIAVGARVAVHYQVSCGRCPACDEGAEQFCQWGEMIGNQRDGGFAEFVAVPVRNLVAIPTGVDLRRAAVTMCSTATVLHALRRTRLAAGETVALYGMGGLGMSALLLAQTLGAAEIYAVDVNRSKLELAAKLGAVAIDASATEPVEAIRARGGADLALELVGLPQTTQQAVRCLRRRGRAGLVGLAQAPAVIHPYFDVIANEIDILGVMDHLLQDARDVIGYLHRGELDLSRVVTDEVPLTAAAVNAALDNVEAFGDGVRTVVVPEIRD
jgi:D-arabinose 1-dehydrogenase-like Zn-dependent alcohol dehydrogenase